MKVSRKWLQTYIEETLPTVEEIAERLTMSAFEIESIESDDVIDVKILPDRAHYALSHYGVASDIAVAFGYTLKPKNEIKLPEISKELQVEIEDVKLCRRYTGAIIKGIKVGPSPAWLKDSLEAIGQRSINNIVDATNYVMFSVGQPTHVFDLKKIENKDGYKIAVKKLAGDEKIVTLDNKPYELKSGTLVIADGNNGKTLAIAGVKGGAEASVDEDTSDILLESANFDPIIVRKTGRSLGLVTDAQKRFENELTPELAIQGLSDLIKLITEIAGGTVEGYVDVYPESARLYKVGVSIDEINKLLGVEILETKIEEILNRFGWNWKKVIPKEIVGKLSKEFLGRKYKNPSSMRYDAPSEFSCSSLVSYIYVEAGYWMPSLSIDKYVYGQVVEKNELSFGDLVFSNTGEGVIRTETVEWFPKTKVPEGVDHVGIYIDNGEVLHATKTKGVVLIEKLDESDRFKNIVGYRRIGDLEIPRYVVTIPNERLDLRIKEDLIEEIGRVYGYEHIEAKMPEKVTPPEVNQNYAWIETLRSLFIQSGYSEVYTYALRDKGDVELANPLASDKAFLRSNLSGGVKESLELNKKNKDLLGLKEIKIFEIGNVFTKDTEETHVCFANEKEVKEMTLKEAVEHMKIQNMKELPVYEISQNKFKPISIYPYIVRDIAVWIPEAISPEEIVKIVKAESGELLINEPQQFDTFTKEGRTSYAYRMIYQSMDRTLTIEEVNIIMQKITDKLNSNEGWKVR